MDCIGLYDDDEGIHRAYHFCGMYSLHCALPLYDVPCQQAAAMACRDAVHHRFDGAYDHLTVLFASGCTFHSVERLHR